MIQLPLEILSHTSLGMDFMYRLMFLIQLG